MTGPALPPEEQPVVVRDVHPATVTLPDGTTLTKAKVYLTQQRLYVWTEPGRVPTLTHVAAFTRDGLVLPKPGASKGKAWTVPTAAGPVTVQPTGGCGCGSALKMFTAFRPLHRGQL